MLLGLLSISTPSQVGKHLKKQIGYILHILCRCTHTFGTNKYQQKIIIQLYTSVTERITKKKL